MSIDFAYRTFRWESEATLKAHVHCVIIGFSTIHNNVEKRLYNTEKNSYKIAKNISLYLVDSPNIFIESRKKPVCSVPKMTTGNRPADGGNLIIEAEDYKEFIRKEPNAVKYIKKFMGSVEYI